MSGITTWRVNSTIECALVHRTRSSPTTCGVNHAFGATPGTGFSTSGPSFASTLSGTATTALQVECYGLANNADPGNRVGDSFLQILGLYVFAHPD